AAGALGAGGPADVADAEVVGADRAPGHAYLEPGAAFARAVLDILQIDDRIAGHGFLLRAGTLPSRSNDSPPRGIPGSTAYVPPWHGRGSTTRAQGRSASRRSGRRLRSSARRRCTP